MKTLFLPVLAGLLSLSVATAQTDFYPPSVEDSQMYPGDLAVLDLSAGQRSSPDVNNAFFPGLQEYVHQNIRYPRPTLEAGVEGVVSAEAIVEADGKLTGITVTEGLSFSCDREVLLMLSDMPAWKPARRNGEAFAQKVFIRVRFRLKPY